MTRVTEAGLPQPSADWLDDMHRVLTGSPAEPAQALQRGTSAEARAIGAVAWSLLPELYGRSALERASLLELGALQSGLPAVADHIARRFPSRPWRATPLEWRHSIPHSIISRPVTSGLGLTAIGGRPVAVAGHPRGERGRIRAWDVFAGAPRGDGFDCIGEPDVIATGHFDGRAVAVGAATRWLQGWDLERAVPLGAPFVPTGGITHAASIGQVDGRPIAIVGDDDGQVTLWDLQRAAPIGEGYLRRTDRHGTPFEFHGEAAATRIWQYDDRVLAGCAWADGTVWIWDLGSERPLAHAWHVENVPGVVALGAIGDTPCALADDDDGTLTVIDLVAGRPAFAPIPGPGRYISAAASGMLGSQPIAACGYADGTIRVWDLARSRQIGPILSGHEEWVTQIAVTDIDGHCVVASAGWDWSMRFWQVGQWPESIGEAAAEPGLRFGVRVSVANDDGRPVASTVQDGGVVRHWDLVSGRQVRDPTGGRAVAKLLAAPLTDPDSPKTFDLPLPDGRQVRVSRPMYAKMCDAHTRVFAVAAWDSANGPVLLSGGSDGTVRIWDDLHDLRERLVIPVRSWVTSLAAFGAGEFVVGCRAGAIVVRVSIP